MSDEPPRRRWVVLALAVGAALVLLADVPGAFTRGDVLRGAALPALAALALLLVALRPSGEAAAGGPALVVLLLPLLVPACGAVGLSPGASAEGALREASPWISLALLSFAFAATLRTTDDMVLAWRTLLGGGLVAAGWTLVHAQVGPFGRPGVAGPVLGALAAAAAAVPLRGPRWTRAAVVGLLLVACGATGSRTGFFAGAAGALLATVAAVPARGPGAWRRLLAPGGALVVGVLVLVFARGSVASDASTVRVRLGLWRASATLALERPAFGHGLGSLPAEMPRARDPEEARLSRGRRADQSHQEVLHAAVDGGVPAGLALLAWTAATLLFGVRAARRATSPDARRLAIGATAAFAALAVAGLAEEPLRDPAGALVASIAAGTLVGASLRTVRTGSVAKAALAFAAVLPTACAWVQTRALVADSHLAAWRDAIRSPLRPEEAARLTADRLEKGALAWRPDHPEALYWLGVSEAEAGRYEEARRHFRRALDSDPGRTEALLDIATTFEIENRPVDARDSLLEARRRDPTRYEVPLRLGHLALGPEPVPGRPPDPEFDPVPATRLYNEAAELAPDRFETPVAQARIARRRGDLEHAAEILATARRLAPQAGEVLQEDFRQAEAARKSTERDLVARLALALVADPGLARPVHAEAVRLLDEGERQEESIRAAAARDPANADFTSAKNVFDAATTRLAALLAVRADLTEAEIEDARVEADARRWRRSLARWRAVLNRLEMDVAGFGALPPPDSLGRWGNLILEAAKVAQRVPGSGSQHLYARGHLVLGAEMLARGAWTEARRLFEAVLKEDPESADAWYGLARAQARLGVLDEAEKALLESFRRDRGKKESARRDPDLETLRSRPRVREALGG